jgi:hypothetical protein
MAELEALAPNIYNHQNYALEVPYPGDAGERLDIRFGPADHTGWAIEVKMMRLFRNNGDREPAAVGHLLSPYEGSALSDCDKLLHSAFPQRKAIMIYGFDYDGYPLDVMLEAFVLLATRRVSIQGQYQSDFAGLIHPHHQRGSVVAWEMTPLSVQIPIATN